MPRRRVNTCIQAKANTISSIDKQSPDEDTGMDWRETKTAEQCLSHLCLSEHLSDISFVFKGHQDIKLPAHKFVLSMRSPVFEAMFFGSLSEARSTIYIEDIEPETMKAVLRYVYSDKPDLKGSNVLRCLYAAKKYALTRLVQQCSSFLECNIDSNNVCSIHEQAVFYDIKPLQEKCFDYILENASHVFSTDGFADISHSTLCNILKHDNVGDEEVNIFQAALKWSKHDCKRQNLSPDAKNLRGVLGEALYAIRFPIMPIEEFATVVTATGILNSEEQVQVYQYNATKGSFCLERTNMYDIIIIDLRKEISTHNSKHMYSRRSKTISRGKGGILTVSTERYYEEDLLQIKHISGSFVPNVERVTDQTGADVANYRIVGNKLTFQSPIDMTYGGTVTFHGILETDHMVEQEKECLEFISFSMPLEKQINGITCYFDTVPTGLETISFVKRREQLE